LIGKSKTNRILEKCRGRWEKNTKMDPEGIESEDVDSFTWIWSSLVNTLINILVP
jgi:hypothetical protein